jgi:hypothetical protein
MDKHESNVIHQETRWKIAENDGGAGDDALKTVDIERTEIGHTYLKGSDGGMWFKIIRVKIRSWWHHLDASDPGFEISYQLEIGCASYGIGYHTTIPIMSVKGLGAIQGAIDILKKDREDQAAAGATLRDYDP